MGGFNYQSSGHTSICKIGIIEPGKKHSCSECSQEYKHTADFMANEDSAAVIGADEHGAVPALTGEYSDLSAHEAVEM